MNRDYEIIDGIYLVKDGYELDLHNDFDFKNMEYMVSERKVVLRWMRSNGGGVPKLQKR